MLLSGTHSKIAQQQFTSREPTGPWKWRTRKLHLPAVPLPNRCVMSTCDGFLARCAHRLVGGSPPLSLRIAPSSGTQILPRGLDDDQRIGCSELGLLKRATGRHQIRKTRPLSIRACLLPPCTMRPRLCDRRHIGAIEGPVVFVTLGVTRYTPRVRRHIGARSRRNKSPRSNGACCSNG